MSPARLARGIARLRPLVPDPLLRGALELAAAARGATPSLTPPAVERVLVIAPHPDDESIGCGGLLARLAAEGVRVSAVLATDGEATIGSPHAPVETARRRRDEFLRAFELLGGVDPVPLGLPDGGLDAHLVTLATALGAAIAREDPDLVLTPWPFERHPDHRAVTEALALTLEERAAGPGGAPSLQVWGYEAHTPIPFPSHVIDVTDTLATKRAALEVHATAALAFDLRAVLGLGEWRSIATSAGRGHAEAFLALDLDETLSGTRRRSPTTGS